MTTLAPPSSRPLRAPSTAATAALRAGTLLDDAVYQSIRRRMVLDHCKWDPQVGDVETIGRFGLICHARRGTSWQPPRSN
jgi:hypothetical protein